MRVTLDIVQRYAIRSYVHTIRNTSRAWASMADRPYTASAVSLYYVLYLTSKVKVSVEMVVSILMMMMMMMMRTEMRTEIERQTDR